MKYFIELISKIDFETTLEDKHSKLNSGLRTIPEPWGIGNNELSLPNFGKQLSAVINFTKFLKKGIKGEIIYHYRGNTSIDKDDRIYLKFDPSKIDFLELTSNVFKQYISFFDPTEAQIFNEDVIYFDYDNRHNYDLNSYIRFCQVFYWDQSFCQNEIGLPVSELKEKITDHVESVELFRNGIYVIVNSKILTLDESNEVHDNLRSILFPSVNI